MRRGAVILAAGILAASLLAAGGAGAQAPAPRAVSLDYCADQFLIALAEPDAIAGVSPGADDDYSYMRDEAAGLPALRPNAEEILARRPGVVLRAWGGDARLVRLLEEHGARVVTLDYANDFDGVRANIRRVAQALGREAKGAALIAGLDARLDALKQNQPQSPRQGAALYVTPGGVTAGAGTMIDAIFTAAGLANAAAEAGKTGWPPLPAEAIVLDPPALIVAGFFNSRGEKANHWSAARHPVFARLFAETPTVHLTADVLSCPGWYSVEAAERIAAGFAGAKGDRR